MGKVDFRELLSKLTLEEFFGVARILGANLDEREGLKERRNERVELADFQNMVESIEEKWSGLNRAQKRQLEQAIRKSAS